MITHNFTFIENIYVAGINLDLIYLDFMTLKKKVLSVSNFYAGLFKSLFLVMLGK